MARRVRMNCLYSGSAAQERVRDKGLWPVPVLCPGKSVSRVPKLTLNRPKKFLWAVRGPASPHTVFHPPLV